MSVEISGLANGLTVVTHTMPHIETAAIGIWVKAGARDELPEENGIAHFLEHMAFKGTTRRSAQAIAEEIENVGGEINAATGMETTTYYARVLKADWQLALDILADIFTESTLDADEMERERDVILQEIAAAKDQPDDLVFDLAQAASYGDHPLGRSILGPAHLIESLSRDQMAAWRDRNYWASRIVVCAAGNIDHQKLAKEAEKQLGHLQQGQAPQRQSPTFMGHASFEQKPLTAAPSLARVAEIERRFEDSRIMVYIKRGASLAREFKWLGSYRYCLINLGGHSVDDLEQRYHAARKELAFRF